MPDTSHSDERHSDAESCVTLFPLMCDLSRELGFGLAVVRAAVLQAALPQIAAALADQSTFVLLSMVSPPNKRSRAHRSLGGTNSGTVGALWARCARALSSRCPGARLLYVPAGPDTQPGRRRLR